MWKARSRSSAPRAPTSPRIMSSSKMAASCSASRKPSVPGMPAWRHGPAKKTSIPVRSASRSSIAATTGGIRSEDGRIGRCAREAKRAWHPGVASWAGEEDVNSCSIGVEIVNRGHDWGYPEYPLRQIAAVIALCRGIMLRRKVPSHRVLGHSDVAPARKKDPGEKFPWHSLANSGVGHWVQPAPIVRGETLKLGTVSDDVLGLQQALAKYGYGVPTNGNYDGGTMEVVTAFQRHFRPARVDGVADHSTLTTLQSLLTSLSTDAKVVAAR